LGLLYKSQGKLDEAKEMYQRALQGKEKAWGPDHTSTLNTVNDMGSFYADQGQLDDAEKMYQRTLQGCEKTHGPENVTKCRPALNAMESLGNLYDSQGHPDKAKVMLSRANTGLQSLLGPSSDECQRIERRITSLDITQDTTRDSKGLQAGVEVTDIAFAKKKSRSVVGKLMGSRLFKRIFGNVNYSGGCAEVDFTESLRC